jgi:hypothetical protein
VDYDSLLSVMQCFMIVNYAIVTNLTF